MTDTSTTPDTMREQLARAIYDRTVEPGAWDQMPGTFQAAHVERSRRPYLDAADAALSEIGSELVIARTRAVGLAAMNAELRTENERLRARLDVVKAANRSLNETVAHTSARIAEAEQQRQRAVVLPDDWCEQFRQLDMYLPPRARQSARFVALVESWRATTHPHAEDSDR